MTMRDSGRPHERGVTFATQLTRLSSRAVQSVHPPRRGHERLPRPNRGTKTSPPFPGNHGHAAVTTLILVAATCWGIAGGVGGVLVARGWDPLVVSFYRGALTLVFAIFWLLLSSERRGLGCRQLWAWSALSGAGVAGAFSFYFAGMKTGNVAVAATLLYSAPVFVFVAEYALGRERMTLKKVLGLFFVSLGVALLSGVFVQSATGIGMSAVAFGLLSGACYALFIFGFQKAGTFGDTPVVMTAAFAVETVLLATLAGADIWPAAMQPIDACLIFLLGVLGGGVSFLLYIVGLKNSSASAASVLGMAEPLTAAAFGFVVLGSRLIDRQSQKMTAAARAMADKKTFGQRS